MGVLTPFRALRSFATFVRDPSRLDEVIAFADELSVSQLEALDAMVARVRQQGELRYRALAESVPAVVLRMNATGELDYVNRRWLETTRADPSPSIANSAETV